VAVEDAARLCGEESSLSVLPAKQEGGIRKGLHAPLNGVRVYCKVLIYSSYVLEHCDAGGSVGTGVQGSC
jgi:hypothetical protein